MNQRHTPHALWFRLGGSAAFVMAMVMGSAQAGPLDSLSLFLKTTQQGRADFTQTVTSAPKTGGAESGAATPRKKTSTGTFSFKRPLQFRFDYKKPFPQLLLADGKTLWLHDPDLNQVIARSQSEALTSTPAALIAQSNDLSLLQKAFIFEALADRNGLQWLQAVPKSKDGLLQSIQVGLRVQGSEVQLAELVMQDSLGQVSTITFQSWDHSASPASQFQFTPPKGADVLRQ